MDWVMHRETETMSDAARTEHSGMRYRGAADGETRWLGMAVSSFEVNR